MDDPRIWAAWISGAFLLVAGLVSTFVALLKHRLECRRLRHDEIRWLLELHGELERKLLEARLETYPDVFKGLQQLSHYPPSERSRDDWLGLAATVNDWGYGKAALVMLPDTRAAIFKLREALRQLADGKIDAEQMMAGARTDVAELMQRDLNQNGSVWRENLPSLMSQIAKVVDKMQPPVPWWRRLLLG